jgi:hypothetical protein
VAYTSIIGIAESFLFWRGYQHLAAHRGDGIRIMTAPAGAAVQSTCGYPAAVAPASMMRDSTAGGGSDEPWFRRVRGGSQTDPERSAGFRGGGGPGDLAAVHLGQPVQQRCTELMAYG